MAPRPFFAKTPRHFGDAAGIYGHERQPDAVSERAAQGRRPVRAHRGGAAARGLNIYIKRKMAVFNANACTGPYGIEAATCLDGRAIRFSAFFVRGRAPRSAAISRGFSVSRHSGEADYFRYPNLWNTDLRASRTSRERL